VIVFSEDYWLLHCEGYRVDTARGHEGYVEELLFGAAPERPDRLAVRCGPRLVQVPAEEIDRILPDSETLVVRRIPGCRAQ
jgi:hypothetical protein